MKVSIKYFISAFSILFATIIMGFSKTAVFDFVNAHEKVSDVNGDWQFIDSDSSYNEITISNNNAFLACEECGDPTKLNIRRSKDSLYFSDGVVWIFKSIQYNSIQILKNKKHITLYRIYEEEGGGVEDFYEWVNAPDRNGNGTRIFYEGMAERKETFIKKFNH